MPVDNTVGGAPPQGVSEDAWFDQRYFLGTNSPKHPNKRPFFANDPAGSARRVMVCHLQSSDPPLPAAPAQRTEISARNEYARPGEERWYALSFYLNKFWPIYDRDTLFVLWQLHTSQTTGVFSPPLHFSVTGNQMTLTLRHNLLPVPPPFVAVGNYATKDNRSQTWIDLGKLVLEQWYSFVINIGWSWQAAVGHLKVWMNGNMVMEQYQHPNCYQNLDDTLGNYPKIGIYAPAGFGPRWDSQVAWVQAYIDYVTMGAKGSSTVELFAQTPYKGPVEPTWSGT